MAWRRRGCVWRLIHHGAKAVLLPLPPVHRGERVGVRGGSFSRRGLRFLPWRCAPSPPTRLPRSTGGEGSTATARLRNNLLAARLRRARAERLPEAGG